MTFDDQVHSLTGEVTHWRADEAGAHLRMWIKDDHNRVVSVALLTLSEGFLETLYQEAASEAESARQMQLRLWP